MAAYFIRADMRVDTNRTIERFESGKVIEAATAMEAKKKFKDSFDWGVVRMLEYTNFYKIED